MTRTDNTFLLFEPLVRHLFRQGPKHVADIIDTVSRNSRPSRHRDLNFQAGLCYTYGIHVTRDDDFAEQCFIDAGAVTVILHPENVYYCGTEIMDRRTVDACTYAATAAHAFLDLNRRALTRLNFCSGWKSDVTSLALAEVYLNGWRGFKINGSAEYLAYLITGDWPVRPSMNRKADTQMVRYISIDELETFKEFLQRPTPTLSLGPVFQFNAQLPQDIRVTYRRPSAEARFWLETAANCDERSAKFYTGLISQLNENVPAAREAFQASTEPGYNSQLGLGLAEGYRALGQLELLTASSPANDAVLGYMLDYGVSLRYGLNRKIKSKFEPIFAAMPSLEALAEYYIAGPAYPAVLGTLKQPLSIPSPMVKYLAGLAFLLLALEYTTGYTGISKHGPLALAISPDEETAKTLARLAVSAYWPFKQLFETATDLSLDA